MEIKKRISLLVVALLVVAGLGGGDYLVGGFSTMRGFTTLPVNNWVPDTGGTFTGGITGTTINLTGLFTGTTANLTGLLTGTTLLMTGSASFGGAASVSNTDFEFLSPGTTSLNFDSGTLKGTCLVMRATDGSIVYGRVFETTFTVNTTSCK